MTNLSMNLKNEIHHWISFFLYVYARCCDYVTNYKYCNILSLYHNILSLYF